MGAKLRGILDLDRDDISMILNIGSLGGTLYDIQKWTGIYRQVVVRVLEFHGVECRKGDWGPKRGRLHELV